MKKGGEKEVRENEREAKERFDKWVADGKPKREFTEADKKFHEELENRSRGGSNR